MSIIIPRNTTIPCLRREIYTTDYDYQTQVQISVYEGESLHTDENHFLDQFTISNIESAKRGVPQIAVEFSVDSNGILTVSAKDCNTNSSAQMEIRRNKKHSTSTDIENLSRTTESYMSVDAETSATVGECKDVGSANGDTGVCATPTSVTDARVRQLIESCMMNVVKQVRSSTDATSDEDIVSQELRSLFNKI
uniref:Heat shock cognate 70 kDa protein 2 n=1 Tax=Lygus hesperus TaxID=30085 RepID=A0A0A9VT18_LYGHE